MHYEALDKTYDVSIKLKAEVVFTSNLLLCHYRNFYIVFLTKHLPKQMFLRQCNSNRLVGSDSCKCGKSQVPENVLYHLRREYCIKISFKLIVFFVYFPNV